MAERDIASTGSIFRLPGRKIALIVVMTTLVVAPSQSRAMPDDVLSEDKAAPASDSTVNENTGAARVAIPIEIPPGPGGLVPSLAFTYSSETRNGILGVGWGIPIGEISCAARFGVSPSPGCTRYELNGQLLVGPDDQSPPSYHTQVESFSRIVHNEIDDSWEVTSVEGRVSIFGGTPASRIAANGSTVQWLLSEIRDPFEEAVVTFDYQSQGDKGVLYPSQIRYGATSGSRVINFLYETRPDSTYEYPNGVEQGRTKRLRELQVLVNGNVHSRLGLRYHVAPSGRHETSLSRLSSVTRYGTDCLLSVLDPGSSTGGCVGLPPHEFTYQAANGAPVWEREDTDWTIPFQIKSYWDWNARDINDTQMADVNGDGLVDLIHDPLDNAIGSSLVLDASGPPSIYLNNGSGWDAPDWSDTTQETGPENESARWTEKLRLLRVNLPKIRAQLTNVSGLLNGVSAVTNTQVEETVEFSFSTTERRPSYRITENIQGGEDDVQLLGSFQFVDVDADGLADLVMSTQLSGMTVWVRGDGYELPSGQWIQSPSQTVSIVFRNTGTLDPENSSQNPWIADTSLAQGLPLFSALNVEGADFVYNKMGTNPEYLQGRDKDETGPCKQWGLGGTRNPNEYTYYTPEWDTRPAGFQNWVCRATFDFRPIFQDFNGDGYVDILALDAVDPTALFIGQRFNLPTNHRVSSASSSVWVQVPSAAPGQPRWQKREDLKPPFPHVWLRQFYGDSVAITNSNAPGSAYTESRDAGVRFVDLNRDGLTDIVWTDFTAGGASGGFRPSGPSIFSGVMLNKGRGTGGLSKAWCASRAFSVEPNPHPATEAASVVPVCLEAQRYELPTDVYATFIKSSYAKPYELNFADMNGDGWMDLIHTHHGNALAIGPYRRTWINNPSATTVWSLDQEFQPPVITNILNGGEQPIGTLIFDANGDGVTDFLSDHYCQLCPPYSVLNFRSFISTSAFPDVLVEHKNGRGGTTSIEYSSAIQQHQSPEAAALEIEAVAHAKKSWIDEEVLPNTEEVVRWRPRAVVAKVTVDGTTPVEPSVSHYRYAHPRWCLEHQTDLGFRAVQKTLPNLSILKSFYYQRHGRSGELSEQTHYASNSGPPLKYGQYIWDLPNPASILGSWGGTAPNFDGAFVGRLASSQVRNEYGPTVGASTGAVQSVVYEYDGATAGYNFPTSIRETRPSGELLTLRTRAEDTQYHAMSLLGLEEMYDETGNQAVPRLLARTHYEYNTLNGSSTRGRVGRRGDWVAWRNGSSGAPPGKTIWTEYRYDTFGNLTDILTEGATDADPIRTTHICYDGDQDTTNCSIGQSGSRSLVVGVRDAMGNWRRSRPHSELPIAVWTDSDYIDEPTTETEVDRFGRIRSEWVFVAPPGGGLPARVQTGQIEYDDSPTLPSVAMKGFVEAGSENNYVWTGVIEDGFGGAWRQLYSVDGNRYAGTATITDPSQSISRNTLPVACVPGGNPSQPATMCLNLDGLNAPATVSKFDKLGRVVEVTNPDGFSRIQYGQGTYSVAGTFTQSFVDVILEKNPKGDLVRRLVDGERTLAVEECDNPSNAGLSDLAGVSCATPDRTEYVLEPTGEVAVIFDAVAVAAGSSGYGDPTHRIARVYDTLGRLVSTVDPNAGQSTVVYDDAGNVRDSIDHPRNLIKSYRYDALDRVTQLIPPAGEETVNYTYIAVGSGGLPLTQPSIILTPSVEKVLYYNELGQLTRADRTVQGTFLTTTYANDLLGRVTKTEYPIKVNGIRTVVKHEYVGGYLKRVCDVVGSETCSSALNQYVLNADYDGTGKLTGISLPGGMRTFDYDPTTQRETRDYFLSGPNSDYFVDLKYKNPSAVPYYDALGNLLQVDASSGDATVQFGGTYSYDNRNRIATWQRTGQSVVAYGYDDLGNLLNNGNPQQYSTTKPHQVVLVNGTRPYTYDASGNLASLKKTGNGSTYHYSYDSANRLTCSGTTGAGSCDQLYIKYAGDGERVLEGAPNGNPYFYAGSDFRYTPGTNANQRGAAIEIHAFGERIASKQITLGTLVTAVELTHQVSPTVFPMIAGGILIVLVGIANGRRTIVVVSRRPGLATLVFVISTLLMLPRSIVAGGGGLPPTESAVYRWIISDHVGSGLVEVDKNGHRVTHLVFAPFGDIVQEVSPYGGRKFFAGHERQQHTGLIYMNARWYEPLSGRFANVDPALDLRTPQAQNAYSYVANNPVNLTDPTGACTGYVGSCEWIGTYAIETGSDGTRTIHYGADVQTAVTNFNIASLANSLAASDSAKLEANIGNVSIAGSDSTGGSSRSVWTGPNEVTVFGSRSANSSVGSWQIAWLPDPPSNLGGGGGYRGGRGGGGGGGGGGRGGGGARSSGAQSGQDPRANARGGKASAQTMSPRMAKAVRDAQRQYPKKAGSFQEHHIAPRYLGGPENGPTVRIDAAYHQVITNAFRDLQGYGRGAVSAERLAEMMKVVYSRYPLQ